MSDRRYTYELRFDFADGPPRGEWHIIDMGGKGYYSADDPVVWTMPYSPEHDDLGEPPAELRAKYEELLAASGWKPPGEPVINPVEMLAGDDCAFDQPCIFGHRVEDHAVYCHNKAWLYAPSKCRRHRGASWIWGDKPWPHEDCPGFKPNPAYTEPTPDTPARRPPSTSA